MSRSLEPTLLSLLPSFHSASSLPQPLTELASSLLAQSRHNASTLKAEEEVARLYACAHIACERLKTQLDLPPIQTRPPVPPRIYKRLYTHLDHILPATSIATSGRIRTPSGKAREAGLNFGSGSTQRIRERATPGKEAALAQFRPKTAGTPTKSTGKKTALSTAGKLRDVLPSWIRHTAQLLCTETDSERIGRTVMAGLRAIITPHGKRSKDAWINEHLGSLLAAVFLLVKTRFSMLETGKPVSGSQYTGLRKQIVKVIQQARQAADTKGEDEDNFWEDWSAVGPKDVDEATKKFNESGWHDQDWFEGIQDQVSASVDIDMDEPHEGTAGDKAQVQRGDTMLQGRWTLTDEKRQDYARWKADILRRCDEMEKTSEAMDVDVSV